MRYVSVELLRAWGSPARRDTITQPAGGPGPDPGPGPGAPISRVSRAAAPHVRASVLLARETSRYTRARARCSLSLFLFLFAILIEPRYERIERSIGIDPHEDLWSSPLVITIHRV